MPEHVYLLVSNPPDRKLSTAIQALKLGFARRVLADQRRRLRNQRTQSLQPCTGRIWQARYYDFNVCTTRKRIEKLRYIHRNPLKRGLVTAPELWLWSSFRTCAYAESGPVVLNEWSAHKLNFTGRTTFAQ